MVLRVANRDSQIMLKQLCMADNAPPCLLAWVTTAGAQKGLR